MVAVAHLLVVTYHVLRSWLLSCLILHACLTRAAILATLSNMFLRVEEAGGLSQDNGGTPYNFVAGR